MKKYLKTQKLDFKTCAEFVPKRVTLDLLRIYYVILHSKSLVNRGWPVLERTRRTFWNLTFLFLNIFSSFFIYDIRNYMYISDPQLGESIVQQRLGSPTLQIRVSQFRRCHMTPRGSQTLHGDPRTVVRVCCCTVSWIFTSCGTQMPRKCHAKEPKTARCSGPYREISQNRMPLTLPCSYKSVHGRQGLVYHRAVSVNPGVSCASLELGSPNLKIRGPQSLQYRQNSLVSHYCKP